MFANPEPWMEDAFCRNSDSPESWEADTLRARYPKSRRRAAAEALCAGCPLSIKAKCADYAVESRAAEMVYAGVLLRPSGHNKAEYEKLTEVAAKCRESGVDE